MTYIDWKLARHAAGPVWPSLPDGVDGREVMAIARMVERICGTQAAATYLAEALAWFARKPSPPEAALELPH